MHHYHFLVVLNLVWQRLHLFIFVFYAFFHFHMLVLEPLDTRVEQLDLLQLLFLLLEEFFELLLPELLRILSYFFLFQFLILILILTQLLLFLHLFLLYIQVLEPVIWGGRYSYLALDNFEEVIIVDRLRPCIS